MLFFLASVNETKKPKKPVNISVTMNPTSVNTKILCSATPKRVEKIRMETSSLVPRPAKVIGIYLAIFATGKSNRKLR